GQVALAEEQQTKPPQGTRETCGVSNRLSNPEPLVPKGPALGERAQLGMTSGEVDMGLHGGQDDEAEALGVLRFVEERQGRPETVDRPAIVALGQVGCAEAQIRQRLPADIPAGRGEYEDALAQGDGLVICAHKVEMA